MQIISNNKYNPAYTSRINPIEPFKVQTAKGVLNVAEINYDRITPKFIKKITEFFCENFSHDTNDPAWLNYNKLSKSEKKDFLDTFENFYGNSIRDEGNQHLTMLVATDSNKNIQGACLSYGCEDVPKARYNTLYIDSLAVNKEYRGNSLARLMLEKSIDANRYIFTDVFLTGEKVADGFYKKLGFRDLSPDNADESKIINHIAKQRPDYPKYTSFLTRIIQESRPRWYEICAKSKRLQKD